MRDFESDHSQGEGRAYTDLSFNETLRKLQYVSTKRKTPARDFFHNGPPFSKEMSFELFARYCNICNILREIHSFLSSLRIRLKNTRKEKQNSLVHALRKGHRYPFTDLRADANV